MCFGYSVVDTQMLTIEPDSKNSFHYPRSTTFNIINFQVNEGLKCSIKSERLQWTNQQ